ncbi:MAG TPA: gliding motility protein GldN [Chitinophagaceae bacterium]|nr:gliding motility protein GldN [Chitinophagaceae bacterium]HNU14474.1 gliding motility protein GldN [Chitinophagaceae bacterium]
MKFLKFGLCLVVSAFLLIDANAQRPSKKRKDTNNPSTNPAPPTTGGNEQQQNNNNQPPSGYDPLANLPITYDTTSNDISPKKSLRNDNAFDKGSLTQRTPLIYEHLRWDDALYAEKVWRELDLREKMNKIFMYEAVDDNGSQIFVNMLMKAVQTGEVTAFSDDRFTTPLAIADVQQLTSGKLDTFPIYDTKQIDKIVGWNVTRASFDAKSVTRIRLKEEWVFDRESSRMFVRILGIGLLKTEYIPNTTKERGTSSLFWVYYPDLRPMLVKAEVYNPKNMGQSRMTWEELFESRMFSSYIVKSTLDNPGNKMIRNYINDPILRLLEGENIKEKIFNFEQDLWSY